MSKSVKVVLIVMFLIIVGLTTYIIVDKVIGKKEDNQTSNAVVNSASSTTNTEKNNTEDNNVSKETKAETKTESKTETTKTTTTAAKSFSADDLAIGKFRLGEYSKDAESEYTDKITSVKEVNEDATGRKLKITKYGSLGLEIQKDTSKKGENGELARIILEGSSTLSTARGIKIGDSKDKVLEAYAKDSILSDKNGLITVGFPGDEPVYESKGKIFFEIENGKVVKIIVAYGIAE